MGIAAGLLDSTGRIDVTAFVERVISMQPVGECECGGALRGFTEPGRGLIWCTTRCTFCGNERTSPAGRTRAARARDKVRVKRRPAQPAWVRQLAAEVEARRFPDAA